MMKIKKEREMNREVAMGEKQQPTTLTKNIWQFAYSSQYNPTW